MLSPSPLAQPERRALKLSPTQRKALDTLARASQTTERTVWTLNPRTGAS